MALDKVLYTAHATSTGGRTGTTESSDGAHQAQLSTPKEMGGDGGPGTNPEQLFAAGYSACFIGAMKAVAAAEDRPAGRRVDQVRRSFGPMAGKPGLRHRRGHGDHRAGHGRSRRREAGPCGARGVPVFERHARQHRRRAHRGLTLAVRRRPAVCANRSRPNRRSQGRLRWWLYGRARAATAASVRRAPGPASSARPRQRVVVPPTTPPNGQRVPRMHAHACSAALASSPASSGVAPCRCRWRPPRCPCTPLATSAWTVAARHRRGSSRSPRAASAQARCPAPERQRLRRRPGAQAAQRPSSSARSARHRRTRRRRAVAVDLAHIRAACTRDAITTTTPAPRAGATATASSRFCGPSACSEVAGRMAPSAPPPLPAPGRAAESTPFPPACRCHG